MTRFTPTSASALPSRCIGFASLFSSLILATCLSLPAQAEIDFGQQGDGELFFNIWSDSHSYSRDLDIRMDRFEDSLAEAGPIALSWPADATLTAFLAKVENPGELRWNVVAIESKGARRVLTTYTPPLPTELPDAGTGRRLVLALQVKLNSINLGLNGAGAYLNPADDAQSAVFKFRDAGYAGDEKSFGTRLADKLGFDSTGTLANDSAATGLGFMRLDIAPFGLKPAVPNAYSDQSSPLKVWLDTNRTLHIGL